MSQKAGNPVEVFSPNDGLAFDTWQPISEPDVVDRLDRLARARGPLSDDIALRKTSLERCMTALEKARQPLIDVVVREVAKKPEEADGEVDYAISFLAHCRELLDSHAFEQQLANGHLIRQVSLAGALLICPFNDPLAGLTRKIGPAIAAGCPVIVKPSSQSILCAQGMFDAFSYEGIGDEIQLLATSNPQLVQSVLEHNEIGIVSFTGSTEVGRDLAVKCAAAGKKSVMELGGNCPYVVFESADLDQAIEDLVIRKLKAAGQACSSVNRVFVEQGAFDTFSKKLLGLVETLKLGPSTDVVDLGPVRTLGAANGLVDMALRAQADGERLLTAAPKQVQEGEPYLYPFTVVQGADESLFDQRETFGPLLSVRPFSNAERLFDRLSRERHALVSYFYTAEPEKLTSHLGRLRFGSVGINSTAIQGPDVPTGGFWEAGHGREGGVWGMNEYLTTVNQKTG
jgi:succinate-semialdehyde dehydrogenase/glutarate-semialdehyde dehydrogenase